MPEQQEPRRPWFHLITGDVLSSSGPGRTKLRGADVYAGAPSPPPGDRRTQDVYAQAERIKAK